MLIKSIIMGIIQGLTEFLPVSSSGHLAIFGNLLGMESTGLLFEVMLHFGTLVAIFIVYWKDIVQLIIEGFGLIGDVIKNCIIFIRKASSKNERNNLDYKKVIDKPYRKFVLLVIVSSIPTAILGFAIKDFVDAAFNSLLLPGIGLLITSILLFFADRLKTGKKDASATTYKNALIIGLFQGFAVMPGISRSGSTIIGGLLNGLERNFAIKYSFIMSIPAVLGASLLSFKDLPALMEGGSSLFMSYLAGTIVSAIVGYICIKSLIVLLNKKKFHYFSYYCFGAGLLSVIASFFI